MWGVFENYRYALTSDIMRTGVHQQPDMDYCHGQRDRCTGLARRLLADRVRYEPLAKAIIFLPMAISFVGAGVIWNL